MEGSADPDGAVAAPLLAIESRIRAEWAATGLPRELSARRLASGGAGFVMYDGLSSPYGTPHLGHLLSGYVKDAFQRYRTMRGDRVRHRYAWDCHIQPIEGEVEARLGITRKTDVTAAGIERFLAACKESVDAHTTPYRDLWWEQARSTDPDDDIRTYRLPYMESVLWAFSMLWHRGYIRRGERVLDYCLSCEVPLSQRETAAGAPSWRDRTEVTLAVTLLDGPEPGAAVLVVVPEPWLLLGQTALGVRRDARYVALTVPSGRLAGRRLIVAEAGMARLRTAIGAAPGDDAWARTGQHLLTGADLVGIRYRLPLPATGQKTTGVLVHAPHALSQDGTGVVSLAPAYSTVDWAAARAAGVQERAPAVDGKGVIGAAFPRYAGRHLMTASRAIVEDLRSGAQEPGTVLADVQARRAAITTCLRCAAELIQYPVPAWFVRVEDARPQLMALAEQVRWLPGPATKEAFTRWAGQAHDWCISRNRYWGTPIPVWVCDNPAYPRTDVYGSLAELEHDFGVRPGDLHRASLDRLTRPNPDDPSGTSTMRRVPEVLSCWFESGSLPFAELHYPFENAERFRPAAPGDLVAESAAQIKGWFFALHAMSALLFSEPAFRACIAYGSVLGPDGRKMTVAAGNDVDVDRALRREGADAVRWYLLTSALLRGGDAQVNEAGIGDASRQVLIPALRAYEYWSAAARTRAASGAPQRGPSGEPELLDRYLIALAGRLAADTRQLLDDYNLIGACDQVRLFVDALTRFYLRRSRARLNAGEDAAVGTLGQVLGILSRVMAPLAPLLSEEIWRGVTGGRSVHLAAWPEPDCSPADLHLLAEVTTVRAICAAARSIRRAHGIRLRQPLAELVIAGPQSRELAPFAGIIELEANVRRVRLIDAAPAALTLHPMPRRLGPRLGSAVQQVIREARAGAFVVHDDGTATVAGQTLSSDEFELRRSACAQDGTLVDDRWAVTLDTTLTSALRAEGLVQDVIHLIRAQRKAADLQRQEYVPVRLQVPAEQQHLVRASAAHIARETRASALVIEASRDGGLRACLPGAE